MTKRRGKETRVCGLANQTTGSGAYRLHKWEPTYINKKEGCRAYAKYAYSDISTRYPYSTACRPERPLTFPSFCMALELQ